MSDKTDKIGDTSDLAIIAMAIAHVVGQAAGTQPFNLRNIQIVQKHMNSLVEDDMKPILQRMMTNKY